MTVQVRGSDAPETVPPQTPCEKITLVVKP